MRVTVSKVVSFEVTFGVKWWWDW